MKKIEIVIALVLPGCILRCVYNPNYEGCLCGPNNSCPPGFFCVINGTEARCSKTFTEEPTDADGDSGTPGEEGSNDGDSGFEDNIDGGIEEDITITDGDISRDETIFDGDEVIADGDKGTETDEIPDDCSLPTPENPLYLFFCLDVPANLALLALWRWVDRPTQDLKWAPETCATYGRRLACLLPDYGSGSNVYFDIMVNNQWACSLGTGLLKVWHQGNELAIETFANQITNEAGLGNGYYIAGWHWLFQTFKTKEAANELQAVDIYIVDKFGTPGPLTLAIRAADGYPIGSDLISATIEEANIVQGWNTFFFPDGPILAPQTQYAIVVRAPAGNYPNHFYSWDRSNNFAYREGRAGEMNDSGTIKDFLSEDVDYIFRVHQGKDFKFSLP